MTFILPAVFTGMVFPWNPEIGGALYMVQVTALLALMRDPERGPLWGQMAGFMSAVLVSFLAERAIHWTMIF